MNAKEAIDFSDSYYTTELVIVVKSDGAYANATTLADFADAKVTAQLNTLHYGVIDQIEGVLLLLKQWIVSHLCASHWSRAQSMLMYTSTEPWKQSRFSEPIKRENDQLDQTDTFELSVADSEIAIGLIKESGIERSDQRDSERYHQRKRTNPNDGRNNQNLNHQLNNSGAWDIKKGHKLNGV